MIKSFDKNEKKALVAIMKFIISTHGKVTEAELEKFNEIAEQKGFEDFSEVFEQVDREVHSLDDIKKLIKTVNKDTHKYDIIKYAMEIAVSDADIEPEEYAILKLMGKEWHIDIKKLLKG